MLSPATLATDVLNSVWTGVAAIGTVGTLIAALVQLNRERQARQRLEREASERARHAQAQRMSAWVGDRDPLLASAAAENRARRQRIEPLNASDEPVYRAVVYLVYIQGAGPRDGRDLERLVREAQEAGRQGPTDLRRMLSVIPPGQHYTTVSGDWGILSGRPGTDMAFTDRAGVHWHRASDGALEEIDQPAVEYYGTGFGPPDWSQPERSS